MTPLISRGTASHSSADYNAAAQYIPLGSAATGVGHDRGEISSLVISPTRFGLAAEKCMAACAPVGCLWQVYALKSPESSCTGTMDTIFRDFLANSAMAQVSEAPWLESVRK